MTSRPFDSIWQFHCHSCGSTHPVGTVAIYNNDGDIQALQCDDSTTVEPAESNGADFDSFNRGRAPIAVLPRGKTGKDRCDQCFMVHSPGQDGCE